MAHWAGSLRGMLVGIVLTGCRSGEPGISEGPDPRRGALLMYTHGCGTCHVIPGVRGADGTIGPPLTHLARRTHIAGMLPNRFDNLVRWIQVPQAFRPGTAMPQLPVDLEEARDMAAHLSRLR